MTERPVVAVFDSGLDYSHQHFSPALFPAGEDDLVHLASLRRQLLRGVHPTTGSLNRAIEALAGIDGWLADVSAENPLRHVITPPQSFAPFEPSWNRGAPSLLDTTYFDFIGHGTANAAACIARGYDALPLKVSYAAINGVDMEGFVDACVWIADSVHDLGITHALWPVGIVQDEAADLFADLVELLNDAGVDVIASGRGALGNIGASSDSQWPADLGSVVAVDEQVRITAVVLSTPSTPEGVHLWHLPGSPLPTIGDSYDPSWIRTFGSAAEYEDFEAQKAATGSSAPGCSLAIIDIFPCHEMPRCPPVREITTLLNPDSPIAFDSSGPHIVCDIWRKNLDPVGRSREPAVTAESGYLVPIATTRNQYGPVFGSSFAAANALPNLRHNPTQRAR